MANAQKLTFVERVLSFIKGDDQEKIRKFQKRSVQRIESTVKGYEADIETLEYKLSDAIEALEEGAVNVDVERCGNVENMDDYIADYLNLQASNAKQVAKVESNIKDKKELIAKYKKLASSLK
tara:strand:+ start:1442 stop:1810 length:369 start_codon:yes stop_codon:yes gene_type:complete